MFGVPRSSLHDRVIGKVQTSFQPDKLTMQTGLAYIPMYSPALKVSPKLPNNDHNSEHSVSSKLVSDIFTHESHDVTAPQLQTPCSEQNVVVKSIGTVIKLSTAVSRFLETPTHPSKYLTKNPKSCERVQKMEEKELEKQKKLQKKANRKALKELRLKDKTKVKGKKKTQSRMKSKVKAAKRMIAILQPSVQYKLEKILVCKPDHKNWIFWSVVCNHICMYDI